jgi:hypothetical protein
MFLLTLGIPYEGFVTDEDGTVYRSLCEPVVVPPESLHVYNPPGVNYDWNTFTLFTKSTLYYFPQDNIPDADDIARKITNRAVRVNPDGTTAVDFGRGDTMVVPTAGSEIRVSVTGSSGSLASPTVHILAKDNSSGKAKETTMTLGAAEAVYGIDCRSMTDVKNLPDVHLSSSEMGTSGGNSANKNEMLDVVNSITGAGGTVAGFSNEIFFSKTFGTWMGKNFRFYSMDWGGNQYTGGKYKFAGKWGTGFKFGSWIFSGGSAGISFWQMLNSTTRSEAIINGMDGTMSIVGMFGTYGFAASIYYFYFAKPCYPLMWQSMQDDAVRRADAAQRGSWGELTVRAGRK